MTKLIISFVIFLALISFSEIHSQVNQDWVQRYNGIGNGVDEASSVAVDNEGNVYVTGVSAGIISNGFLTIKYNSSGVQQWERRHDGVNSPPYPKLTIDNAGNVYVTGFGFTNGMSNATTIKYSSSGTIIWEQNFAQAGIRAIVVDSNQNVYVAGSYFDSLAADFITIKYNSSGIEEWSRRYGEINNDDEAMALDIDNSGNVYVTGYSFSTFQYISTVKYNSTGNVQWVQNYESDFGLPRALKVDNSGNVFVAGITSDTGAIIKYNTSGVLQWVIKDGEVSSLLMDKTGNIYAAGSNDSIPGIETRKYNSSGIQQWIKGFDGYPNNPDGIVPMAIDSSGNIYVSCVLYISGVNSDYATVKYNSEGDSQWVQIYNGPANSFDEPRSIAADNSGNVYVTGYSRGIGTLVDYATIKYSQIITGINTGSNEIAIEYKLEQNYPNPFNPVTVIRYSLIENRFVSLKVYDMLGKEVATLVNEKQNAGTFEVNFEGSKLSSGIYFYRLQAGDFVQTKRMTLVK